MSKIESLTTVGSGYLANSTITANFAKITTALQNTVSRDGSSPNTMTANLDMNTNQLINLGTPTLDLHAATKEYVDDATQYVIALDLGQAVEDADAARDAAELAAEEAEDAKIAAEAAAAMLPLSNFTATANPGVNDDVSEGYSVGSRWVNVTADESYICVDSTNGAAVWLNSTLTLDELGALAVQDTVSTSLIDNDAVTYAKIQNVSAASRLLGRGSASGAGDTEEISVGSGLSLSGTTLSATSTSGPAFAATGTSTQSIGASTWVKMELNTETFDTSSAYDNATNYRFTPLTAGKYSASAIAYFTSIADGIFSYVAIYKNGTEVAKSGFGQGAIADAAPCVHSLIDMNGSTDYLEVFCFNNTGGGSTIDKTKSKFSAFFART